MEGEQPKIIGSVVVNVLEGNTLVINTNIESKNEVRDILKTAEELVIIEALKKASENPGNIITLQRPN